MSAGPSALCSLCQSPIATGEETCSCPGCASVYHRACWDEVGGCGVYGCAHVPGTEKRGELEIPAAHWGRETKPCPACGQEIQAMALRCRHCAAVLGAATPQSAEAWRSSQRTAGELPLLRKRVIILAVCCALPPLSLAAGPLGAMWCWRRRGVLGALPGLHRAILRIALGAAAVQILVVILVLALSGLTST